MAVRRVSKTAWPTGPGLFAEVHRELVASLPAAPTTPARRSPRRTAAMRLCVLASGSGGNASVLRVRGQACVMLDLGLGPRVLRHRLEQAGLSFGDVSAVCLTHLDQDHFKPGCIPMLLGHGVRVHLHRWHVQDFMTLPGAADLSAAGLLCVFDDESFEPYPGVTARPIHLPHDLKGTVGLRVEADGASLGYATDLGTVPPQLIDILSEAGGVDVLAIESNYDPDLELASGRPAFLKQRIMGGRGHLSNDQAFAAVRAIARCCADGRPRRVVLLHRSAQCNHPTRIHRTFAQEPALAARIVLAEQRRRTAWIDVDASHAGQMSLWLD